MLLSEYLKDNNLFEEINNVKEFTFINDNSNTSLSFMFGDRVMSNNVLSLDVVTISQLIVNRFGSKWDTLISSNMDDLNIGSDKTKVIKSTTDTTNNNTGTSESINKVSGYNEDVLITDTGVNNSDSKVVTGNIENENITYELNLKSMFDNLNLLDKTNILNTVQSDIVNYITIYIY